METVRDVSCDVRRELRPSFWFDEPTQAVDSAIADFIDAHNGNVDEDRGVEWALDHLAALLTRYRRAEANDPTEQARRAFKRAEEERQNA